LVATMAAVAAEAIEAIRRAKTPWRASSVPSAPVLAAPTLRTSAAATPSG
jgi:hypothetical protein